MLKVLFITSSASSIGRANLGDRVILAGVKNLIASAFGYYVYQEAGRWSSYPGDPDQFDLIVYAGMPQYGRRHKPSVEERHFEALIDANKSAIFMNIGGGTIHSLSVWAPLEALRMAISGIGSYYRRQQRRIAYRSVRDKTCKLFFNLIGVPAKLRCCPSYFSTLLIPSIAKDAGAIAVISNQNFVTNEFQGDMQAFIADLQNRHPEFELIAHSGTDLGMLGDMGRRHIFFKSEDTLLSYYAGISNLVALRVHAAIPAWTTGANVVAAGFDNRVGMFDDIGMPIPWIKMVNRPVDDIGAEFESLLRDKSKHVPLAARRRLIDAQLRKMTAEIRRSAPSLTELSSAAPVSLENWISYPPAGTVSEEAELYRLSPIYDETTDASANMVHVAAGERAESASKAQTLPLRISAEKLTSRRSSPKKSAARHSADTAHSVLTSAPLYLPAGELVLSCVVEVSDDSQFAQVEVVQGKMKLKNAKVTLPKSRDGGYLVFTNNYPAMPVVITITLPSGSERTNLLESLTIDMAEHTALASGHQLAAAIRHGHRQG